MTAVGTNGRDRRRVISFLSEKIIESLNILNMLMVFRRDICLAFQAGGCLLLIAA